MPQFLISFYCVVVDNLSIAIMASSIKLFQSFLEIHKFIGIHSSQPNQKQWSFNSRNEIFLIISAEFAFSTAAFCVFDATSMFDYGFASYIIITIVTSIIIYLLFVWEFDETLDFVENGERFIEKSKSKKSQPSQFWK